MTVAVLNGLFKPMLEGRLPPWLEVRWFGSHEEALALAPEAEIGWFDTHDESYKRRIVEAAVRLKWLVSVSAGVDSFPLGLLRERGVVFTNGTGLLAAPIAEYVVMLMLTQAKGYRQVVRAQDRHEWLRESPGLDELTGTSALILGYGAIGKEVERRLLAFDVTVSKAARRPQPGVLGLDEWRDRLGEFDWIVISLPATAQTEALIGEAELAAMKPGAVLVNVSRGSVIDQPALIRALQDQRIGGALLDVTTPEPLPGDHPLWNLDNAQVTMHLSGRAQRRWFAVSAERFLTNLDRYHRGERLEPQIDYASGY